MFDIVDIHDVSSIMKIMFVLFCIYFELTQVPSFKGGECKCTKSIIVTMTIFSLRVFLS